MCGRFTLTTLDVGAVARALDASVDDEASQLRVPRYNAAPGQEHLIVLGDGPRLRLSAGDWGWRSHGTGKHASKFLINARSETAHRLRTFAKAFAHARCAIVADGFFEWSRATTPKQPVWIHPRDGGLWLFAGLYQQTRDGLAFTILTTRANDLIAPIHDRMPVIIDPSQARTWLDASTDDLFAPYEATRMELAPVSPKVGNVAYDTPECIEPITSPGEPRQRSLF